MHEQESLAWVSSTSELPQEAPTIQEFTGGAAKANISVVSNDETRSLEPKGVWIEWMTGRHHMSISLLQLILRETN